MVGDIPMVPKRKKQRYGCLIKALRHDEKEGCHP